MNNKQIYISLFMINYISYYLEISIYSDNEIVFPNVVSFIIGFIVFCFNINKINRGVIHSIIYILVIVIIGILISSLETGVYLKKISSLLQITAVLISGIGIYILSIKIGRRSISRIFCCIFFVILLGSLFEIYGGLRGVSDSVRLALYSRYAIYGDTIRDLSVYGAVRPNFFGREPSLVGVNIGFALAMWFLTNTHVSPSRRVFGLMAATAAALFVTRSPTVLFFAVTAISGLIFFPRSGSSRKLLCAITSAAIILFCFMFIPVLTLLNGISGGGLDFIMMGRSFFIRQVLPPITAVAVVSDNPIFGVGIGAFDTLDEVIEGVFARSGVLSIFPDLIGVTNSKFLVSNAFWEYWMFFGIGGGAVIFILIRGLLRSLSIATNFPILAMMLAAQNFGGVVAYRIWFFFFMYSSAVSLINRNYAVLSDCVSRPMQIGSALIPFPFGRVDDAKQAGRFD